MLQIDIVIPVYNEEKNIVPLYEAINNNLSGKHNFTVIFVNDGSTDSSVDEINKLKEKYANIKLVSFTRNFGHQTAIFAGLKYSKSDAVITMDADFQDPPELLIDFVEQWQKKSLIVYGRRIQRNKDGFVKKFTAKLYYSLLSASSKIDTQNNVGDFRLLDRKVVNIILNMPSEAQYLRGIVAWTGFKHTYVDYERPERNFGETKYPLSKMFSLALNGLFSFSKLPLKFGLILGVLSIVFGMLFMGYIIFDTLVNNEIYPLYKWLIVVILMFMGFLFILFWIIAEYISRIYNEKLNRPLFIIDEDNSDVGS